MKSFLTFAACLGFAGSFNLRGQTLPSGLFVDIDATNTAAVGGTPSPFFTDSATASGFTTGQLWRRRTGFGFDVTGNREIYEKDANGGIGDAAALVTTVTGLTPGQSYGVYVAYLSVATESWQVKAGLTAGSLTLFTPSSPAGAVTDYGLSTESGSNRRQYLGYVGNAVADAQGRLLLYSDDGDGTATNWTSRSWLEGFFVGAPYTPPPPTPLPGGAVQIAPDGAWTWFNDERSIIHQGSLYSGYVLADGRYGITRYDLADGLARHMIISTSTSTQKDDHNNPSITVLPDGRLLVIYSKHISGSQFYQRTSLIAQPATIADWGPEIIRSVPAANTYANTYLLTGENNAIYNFHRCINFNPTLTISTNNGVTWGTSRQLLGTGTGSTRPYPRYTSNGVDRIDAIYTDGHPRDVNNSVYHMYYKSGGLYKTDGTLISLLANIPLDHDAGQRGNVIYQYSDAAWGAGQGPDDWIPTARGWTWDVVYDRAENPVCVFQAQVGTDATWSTSRIFYYYARWTGTTWQKHFIAQAGRGIYAAESDYGGGMCLDPEDPRIVYISTNAASPFSLGDVNNVPLATNARYEIWRGFTADGGLTFTWTAITSGSTADNLRPIVPLNHGRTECLLWFYGTYTSYTNFSTQVIGRLGVPSKSLGFWASENILSSSFSATNDTDGDGVPDLLEYAFGGDPRTAASSPRMTFDGTSIDFPMDPSRPDVEFTLERSVDLVSWNNVAVLRRHGLPSEFTSGYSAQIPASAGNAHVLLDVTSPVARVFYRIEAGVVR
ncbi:hypothetical protein IMCC26134_01320 [Verrucomicrobia bacterium IMCC26134]|nr:hypothetical protein IMCC26134_01320 [Verrucomicrobia bacterium IMCC26134]